MKNQDVTKIKNLIQAAEINLKAAQKIISSVLPGKTSSKISDSPKILSINDQSNVIEGVYNGESMVDSGQKSYPVPANYASKSKLIEGDKLKLTIAADGSFIFKQIGPAIRKRLAAKLLEREGEYFAEYQDKLFKLPKASITYYKAKDGDQISIIVPQDEQSDYAAFENII